MSSGASLTLELGIGLTSWLIEWCRGAEERLTANQGLASDGNAKLEV
jgi:hypothetical protein